MTKIKKIAHSYQSVYFYILLAACMATVFGFNLGAMLSSKVRLINIFMLEIYDIDSMVNTFMLGSFVGVFLGGRLVYDTGRVQSVIGSFFFGVIGQCTAILAPTFSTLFITEFVVGVSSGVYLISAICYITELSSKEKRGTCCLLIPTFVVLGFLISVLLKDIIPRNDILVVVCLLAAALPVVIVSYLRLPESPRWLALTDSSDKALTELIRLRNSTSEAARELAAINECVLGDDRGITMFFRNSVFRAIVWFFLFIVIVANLSGFAIIPYMSLEIVKYFKAALGILTPNEKYEINFLMLKSILFAVFIGCAVTCLMADKIGRRRILLISCTINEVMLFGIYFLYFTGSAMVGPALMSVCLLIFCLSSVIFLCTFLFLILPELLPVKGREFCLTLIFIVQITALMLGIYFFNRFIHSQGVLMAVCIFMMAGALLFTLIYQDMPEPKNQMLESMENTIFNERSLKAINKAQNK